MTSFIEDLFCSKANMSNHKLNKCSSDNCDGLLFMSTICWKVPFPLFSVLPMKKNEILKKNIRNFFPLFILVKSVLSKHNQKVLPEKWIVKHWNTDVSCCHNRFCFKCDCVAKSHDWSLNRRFFIQSQENKFNWRRFKSWIWLENVWIFLKLILKQTLHNLTLPN